MSSLHKYIAFVAIDQGDLYRVRADGSEFTRLTTNLGVSGSDIFTVTPALSPDGAWLAFVVGNAHRSNIFVIRPDGRDLRAVSAIRGSKFDLYWSPDSRYLAFANEAPSWNATLYTADMSSGQVGPLAVTTAFPLQPWYATLPQSDPTTPALDDPRLPQSLWIPPGTSLVEVPPLGYGYIQGWLRHNTHVLFRTLISGECFIIDSRGEAFYPWQTPVAQARVVGVRPDGMVIAYQGMGGTTLYIHHLDEAEPRVIPHAYDEVMVVGELHWSPDGVSLAYTVHRAQPPYRVHLTQIADGTTIALGDGTSPRWLPDGSHLTYSHVLTPTQPYQTQPVRYELATSITTPLIETVAEMEVSAWYWMPR